MLVLAWDLDENVRQGLTYEQFAKYALMKLGVETDITRFVRRNVPRRVASREETLALLDQPPGKRPLQAQPGNCLAKEPTWPLSALRTTFHV